MQSVYWVHAALIMSSGSTEDMTRAACHDTSTTLDLGSLQHFVQAFKYSHRIGDSVFNDSVFLVHDLKFIGE